MDIRGGSSFRESGDGLQGMAREKRKGIRLQVHPQTSQPKAGAGTVPRFNYHLDVTTTSERETS